MVLDSISDNAFMDSAATDGKKNRGNKTAKLKQCKLDARREQWLSQGCNVGCGKNKGCKEEINGVGALTGNERGLEFENLGMRGRGRENHDSDLGSLLNSPTSPLNGGILGANGSGTHYSRSSSGGSCSGSITEEEEEGGGGSLDDWETVADALAADDKQQKPDCPAQLVSHNKNSDLSFENANSELPMAVSRVPVNTQAWRLDDAFRPQCLPNLSKQQSMPNPERQYGCGRIPWAYNNARSVPSSCPICYEDLDITDTSFLPCLCGFHLCLFCHKRILEEDGRCPGCRKPYADEPVEVEASLTFLLARSSSMISRP